MATHPPQDVTPPFYGLYERHKKSFQIFIIVLIAFASLAAGQLQNCRISWVLTLNSYTVGGTSDPAATTVDQCLNGCLVDLSCRGVQVHHLPANAVECWRFYSDNFAVSSSLVAGYDQYTLQSRCYNGSVCSVKWQYWQNTKFQAGGSQYPGVTAIPACLATCLQTPGCIGVDIKKTAFPIQCFIHFNSSNAGNVLFTQEYDQYLLLDACVLSNISTTTAVSTTSNALSSCWNETLRTQYAFLTQVAANTVDQCKSICINNPQCSVINFDRTTNPPCWVQIDGSPVTTDDVYPNDNVVTYYLLRNCLSSSSSTVTTTAPTACWIARPETQYFGLTQSPYATVQSCQDYCKNSLPDCTIINFDTTTSPPCWVKDFPGPLSVSNYQTNKPDITTYILDRNCNATTVSTSTFSISPSGPGQNCWYIQPNTRNSGLIQISQTTVVSCQSFCQSTPQCNLINFDASQNPPCFIQTSAGSFPSSPDPIVNAYILDRTCSSSSTSSTTSVTVVSVTIPISTFDVCFTVKPMYQYYGLTPISSATTERTCRDLCISTPECTIMDFVLTGGGPVCWIQDTPLVISDGNYFPNNNISNFRLNRTCLNLLNSSSSAVTISPVLCVNWIFLPMNTSLGGVLQPYRTLDSCQGGCVNDLACLAIDYDPAFTECYFHYQASDLNTLYYSGTASQYRLQRNTSCVTIVPPLPKDCYGWTLIERKNSINGIEQPSYNSLALCQIACIANARCLAVDFDTGSSIMCWFHLNASDLMDLYDDQTNNQYILRINPNCLGTSPCFNWYALDFKFSINGVLMPSYHTVDDCKNACIATAGCVAIDYETSSSENCWFHNDFVDLLVLYDSPTVTQYRLIRDPFCSSITTTSSTTSTSTASKASTVSGSRSCVSEIYYDTNSVGGAMVSGISSSMNCWTYCLNTPTCVAVDYDPLYGCWQHNDLNNLLNNRKPNQSPGVTQYVISRNCNPDISITPQTTSTRPPGPPTCVSQIYSNVNSPGGSLVMGIFNSQACVNYCLRVITCVGVDYDLQSGCWQHNDRNVFNSNRKNGTGVTQYAISSDCTSTPSTATSTTISTLSPTCAGSFQVFFNTSSLGASNEMGLTTVLSCLMYCLDNPDACAAIDFDTNTGCWIHLDRVQVLAYRRYPSYGVNQFVMERSCNVPLPVCSFQAFRNTYTPNGLFLTDVRSLTACFYYCLITPSCVAIDYSSVGSCTAHSDLVYVVGNRRTATGNTQFVLNRVNCLVVPPPQTENPLSTTTSFSSSSSSSSSSTTSATTSPITIIPGCPPAWTKYTKTFSYGGIQQAQITNLNSCLDGCARNPNCYAIDVDIPDFACYFHLDPNYSVNNYTGLPTQYRINRQCIGTGSVPGECQNWTTKANTNSINAVNYFQFTTVESCQILCVNIPTCVAVDFNFQTSGIGFGCWIHNSLQDLLPENTYPAENINQYILNRACQGTCLYSWTPYPSNNMIGGIPQRDTTIGGCQARCISIPECTGIDIDRGPGNIFCWLHLSPNLYLFPSTTVDHYQLGRSPDCPETKITTAAPTTTGNPLSFNCNLKLLYSMNSDGGQKLSEPMTKETCASQCISQYPQCLAADSRLADSACFLHNSLSGRKSSQCCTRYEIICNTSSQGTSCQDDFVASENMVPFLQDLVYQSSITTIEQCQVACLNYGQSCLAVVLSAVGRIVPGVTSCYLIVSIFSLNSATPSNDFNLYVRRFCHPNLPVIFSTTPYPTPSPGYCLLDIVFVVDNSGSILDNQSPGVDSMLLVRSFMSSFLTNNVGYYFDHVGIVTFNTAAKVIYDLCNLQTAAAINGSGVSKIMQSLGTTNTPAGFDAAYDMLFNSSRCARPRTARPVIILITDAQTSPEFRSFYQSSLQRLVNTGVTRIAIGITTDVNSAELQQFVSPGLSQGPLLIDSYSQLSYYQTLIYNLISAQCGRAPRIDSGASLTSSTVTTSVISSTSTTQSPTVTNLPVAFGAYLSSSLQGPVNIIRYDQLWAGTPYGYQTQIMGFYSPGGLIFIDLGVGIASGRQVGLTLLVGSREIRVLDWQSTIFNGIITVSISQILYMDAGEFVGVRLNSDSYITSDSNFKYSSFSGFNIAGVMSSYSNNYAMVAEPNFPYYPYYGVGLTIPLVSKVSSLAGNIVNGNSYTCPVTGNYIFTISSGIAANQKTRIALVGLNPRVEISSLSGNRNGVTTLSRTVLLFCSQGMSVTFVLVSGAIADRNLSSFSAQLLQYSGQGQNHVWALYKSYNSDTRSGYPMDPFFYDLPGVNPFSLYDTNNRVVRIILSGYYYLQITAGVQTGSPLNMRLVVTTGTSSSNLLYLISQANNNDGEEFVSHGLVTRLNSGDTLKVVADVPSFIYNTEQGYQTSFIGLYLYP